MSSAASEAPPARDHDRRVGRAVEARPKSLMLMRLAALTAVDVPPVSYLVNLAVASDVASKPTTSSRS